MTIDAHADSEAFQVESVDAREILNADDISCENIAKLVETHTPRFPLSFSFECYGIPFSADGVEGEDGPTLQISGNLGPIPFSAESLENRKAIAEILASDFVMGIERQDMY